MFEIFFFFLSFNPAAWPSYRYHGYNAISPMAGLQKSHQCVLIMTRLIVWWVKSGTRTVRCVPE